MATVSRAAAGALVRQGYPTRIAATAVAAERRDRIIEKPQCKIPRRHITKNRPEIVALGPGRGKQARCVAAVPHPPQSFRGALLREPGIRMASPDFEQAWNDCVGLAL